MIEAVGASIPGYVLPPVQPLLKPQGPCCCRPSRSGISSRAGPALGRLHPALHFSRQLHPVGQCDADSLARATDMKIFHLEDIGPHYARTLRLWRESFLARQRERARAGLSGELRAHVGVSICATAKAASTSDSSATCRCC